MASQVGKIAIEIEKTNMLNGVEQKFQFQFLIPMGCPLGIAYDACFESLQEIINMSKTAADRVDRTLAKDEEKTEKDVS